MNVLRVMVNSDFRFMAERCKGAMQTGFISVGGLSDTKLFSNAVDPAKVAKDGYDGMLKGKLNVTSGLPGWQTPMMKLAPLFPKKTMLSFVYDQ